MSTKPETTSAIIVAASSDIGAALARRWREREWSVTGTFRAASAAVAELQDSGVRMLACDLTQAVEVQQTVHELRSSHAGWDVLVLASGELRPIGTIRGFATIPTGSDARCRVNLLTQLEFVHGLLPSRRRDTGRVPTVLFFAGGGTNRCDRQFFPHTRFRRFRSRKCASCSTPKFPTSSS